MKEGKTKVLFPDGLERIEITKDSYDRLYGDMTLENIELKQEIERLNKELKSLQDSYDIEEEQANYHIDLTDDLIEEVDRLNNIIKKLERLVDDYAWNSYYIKCGNRYLKSEILNDIREIIELKGSDKE